MLEAGSSSLAPVLSLARLGLISMAVKSTQEVRFFSVYRSLTAAELFEKEINVPSFTPYPK